MAEHPHDDADVTRTTLGKPPSAGSSVPSSSSGQGWLSSSGSIDHGRFAPGTVLDGRYRIVGLLGRGGMGEVYRADDMRLGQAVAIKFLPPSINADTRRLAQFHNEVRMARQVSHANVCRVHDIGDVAGTLYLTMEYVDGEDLAASIKRVGRFPEDKALELARQICAGLAAAHDRGVIHRDLKPANIMLDKSGQVRLMDFGLAAAGTAEDIQAGTPAYMAPEQLLGREVTQRSDIFALGLLLFELFTGKRVFTAKTIAELVSQHEAGLTTMPSEIVKGLDPAIENAIVWCLDRDPLRRPPTALAVAAALPGSDPLAAAIAAGETPSPEMVAAAGGQTAAMPIAQAVAWIAAFLVMLVASAVLADGTILPARVPFDRTAGSLFDRARDIEHALGYDAGVADRSSGLLAVTGVPGWLRRARAADYDRALASGGAPAMLFWYRSSAAPLIPTGTLVNIEDPSPLGAGMTTMLLTTSGRLTSLTHSPSIDTPPSTDAIDWPAFLSSAGYDPSRFTPVTPAYVPRVFADTEVAWTGAVPELPDAPLTIEAGAARGRIVYLRVFAPWNPLPVPGASPAPAGEQGATALISFVATVLVVPGMLLIAAFVARANVRKGRGDRAGAVRLAALAMALSLVSWLFQAHHLLQADVEVGRFFAALGAALTDAAVLWLFYLAAEPQVRRVWPHILITWSRLVSGRWRDGMVGRDLLIGAAAGISMTLVSYLFYETPRWLALLPFDPRIPQMLPLSESRYVMSSLLTDASNALQNAMLGVVGLAMLRMVLKKQWLVFAVATALFTPLAARGQFQSGIAWLDLLFGLALVAAILGVIVRFGLFAGIVAFFTHFWTFGMPLTLNTSRQYFQTSLFALGVVVALAVTGFVLARRAAQPRDLMTSRLG